MNFWTIEGWSCKLSLDQKLTTTSLLYSYFSVLHTGWLPVAEAEKKKVKTPKNVLRLHKSRLALFSLNLYLLRSSSLPHQKMLLKTTTSLSASLSTRQDSERFLKRPPKTAFDGTQSVRDWRRSRFKLYRGYCTFCEIRYRSVWC